MTIETAKEFGPKIKDPKSYEELEQAYGEVDALVLGVIPVRVSVTRIMDSLKEQGGFSVASVKHEMELQLGKSCMFPVSVDTGKVFNLMHIAYLFYEIDWNPGNESGPYVIGEKFSEPPVCIERTGTIIYVEGAPFLNEELNAGERKIISSDKVGGFLEANSNWKRIPIAKEYGKPRRGFKSK